MNLGEPTRLADRQDVILGAGYRSARFGTVVMLDDDFQKPPAEIPWLAGALVEDINLICTVPVAEQQSRSRNAASRLAKFTTRHATRSQR